MPLYIEWHIQHIQGLSWFNIFFMYFVQYFHLGSLFFLSFFSLTIPSIWHESKKSSSPSYIEKEKHFRNSSVTPISSKLDVKHCPQFMCSILAVCLIQLQICWPVSNICSGSPKALSSPQVSSPSCSAVVFNLPSTNSSTQPRHHSPWHSTCA